MSTRPLFELHVSGPAFSAFRQVCLGWGLDADQAEALLGGAAAAGAGEGALALDAVERISYVLRIFRLLGQVVEGDQRVWLLGARDEPIFGGRSPLELMMLGDSRGLRQTVRHLERLAGETGDWSD